MREVEFRLNFPVNIQLALNEALKNPYFSGEFDSLIEKLYKAKLMRPSHVMGGAVTIIIELPEMGLEQGEMIDEMELCREVVQYVRKLLKDGGYLKSSRGRKKGRAKGRKFEEYYNVIE